MTGNGLMKVYIGDESQNLMFGTDSPASHFGGR
jgi:hypothetical protein